MGILARVPLASGLLSGRMSADTAFAPDDHRHFNRHGEAFDVGETFSGVDYATGIRAVASLMPLVPPGQTLAQLALRWILMHPAVTCANSGRQAPTAIEENVACADLPPLSPQTMAAIRAVYESHIKASVHHRW